MIPLKTYAKVPQKSTHFLGSHHSHPGSVDLPGVREAGPQAHSLCLLGPCDPVSQAELFVSEGSPCLGLELLATLHNLINAVDDNNNCPLIGASTLHPLALTLRNLLWSY